MKQPFLTISTIENKVIGIKPISCIKWENGFIQIILVDFFEDNNSADFLAFYPNEKNEFISINKNLIGQIVNNP